MLKFKVDKLDGIDEAHQSLYTEAEGGGFVLQVEGVVGADELASVKQKLVDANEEAARRRKALEKWKDLGENPDDVREAMNAKGKQDPQHEQIIASLKQKHEAELAESQNKLTGVLKKSSIAELQAALAGQNIVSAGLEPLSLMAQSKVTFDNDGNLRIMSEDNKPMAGSGADGYATIADLAKQLAASDTGQFFTKDGGVSGGGKPPAANNGNSSGTTITRSQFDDMSQSAKDESVKSGVRIVD